MGETAERLARIVEYDANCEVNRTLGILQSDISALLCEFMDVSGLNVAIEKATCGYELKITAKASRIYKIGNIAGE